MTNEEKLAVIERKINSFSSADKNFWEDIIRRKKQGTCPKDAGEAIIIESSLAELEDKGFFKQRRKRKKK